MSMPADPNPPLRYDTVTFLSDYGRRDVFVGVVHSVLRQLAPSVRVIDLTHDIPPYDVRAGALTLARASQYLTPGVILAVVDPGVGSDRRAVAIEVADGRAVFVGPDNGLLAAAVAMVGGATRAASLDDPTYHLPAPGPTFAGRDIFAPAAAHLCGGVALEDLGTLIDPATLTPGTLGLAEVVDGVVHAEVLWVDHYGNAQLNVDPEHLEGAGERVELRLETPTGEQVRRVARRVHHFAQLGTGELGLAVDSYGLLAVVAGRSSAADELGLAAADPVGLVPLGPDDEDAPVVVTSVELSARPATRSPSTPPPGVAEP
jgi:S-adenosylmethionine hydrolase